MKLITCFLFVLLSVIGYGQHVTNINDIQPTEDYENIHIIKLDTDSNATTFIIWVKQQVKSHKHENHSERLYVIEGEGEMTIGDSTIMIGSGDYFSIPPNTFHSLIVTSKQPVKVISIQAPEFFGIDRVFQKP